MKMKGIIIIPLFALMQLSCSEETFPDCQDVFGNINYPVIAHSHNDYEQDDPIVNALNHGFTSIEVDIAFDGTQLKVSHDDKNLSEKPEFEQLYLVPILNTEIGENGLILLVDIKNYSTTLIETLNSILLKYEANLVSRIDPNSHSNKLKIVLSGELPRQEIISAIENKYLFIDGRLNDVDLNYSSDIVPIISINISEISDSNANHKDELKEIVDQVHDKNKMIRFWNTNDKESVWLNLLDLNVDIIGVDNIEKFCGVMLANDLIN